MTPKVTVVVPVYNVEAYIEKCIQSIMDQTHTDFECLIIDDASPDDSINRIQPLISDDGRFQVVHHKQNQGLGQARNTGIEQAKGEYICFIDSDDYVEPDYLQLMYSTAMKHQAAMCVCDVYWHTGSQKQRIGKNQGDADWKEKINKLLIIDEGAFGAYFFRTRVFQGIRFPKGINEDTVTLLHVLVKNRPGYIPYIDKPLHHYVKREGSITGSISKQHCHGLVYTLFAGFKKHLSEHNLHHEYKDYFALYILRNSAFLLHNILKYSQPDRLDNLKYYKQMLQEPRIQDDIKNMINAIRRRGKAVTKTYRLYFHYLRFAVLMLPLGEYVTIALHPFIAAALQTRRLLRKVR